MIEAVNVHPGFHCVASFATERRAIGTLADHAIVEFALVRIFMAGGAGAVFELERYDFVGAARGPNFMAISASNGNVRASQGEARVFVLRDGELGAMEIVDSVARLATVVERRGGELIVMRVFVTIGAGREFHFVNGVPSRGDVALRAFDLNMFALERIAGPVMLLHAE